MESICKIIRNIAFNAGCPIFMGILGYLYLTQSFIVALTFIVSVMGTMYVAVAIAIAEGLEEDAPELCDDCLQSS